MTLCKVVPGGDDPEPREGKHGDSLDSLTLRGIPPRQVYNLTFCKVVPGGDDPEPRVRKCGDRPGCSSHCYLPPWRQWRVLLYVVSHPAKSTI